MPTRLDRLIAQQAEQTVVVTLSATTERIVEELVQELLQDPIIKQTFRAAVTAAFRQTMDDLQADVPPGEEA
jgi:hypothetical protein